RGRYVHRARGRPFGLGRESRVQCEPGGASRGERRRGTTGGSPPVRLRRRSLWSHLVARATLDDTPPRGLDPGHPLRRRPLEHRAFLLAVLAERIGTLCDEWR